MSARSLYARLRARQRVREERRFRSRLALEAGAEELLLSPHLDDAVLDCWSLLRSERPLRVVNVFAGVPAAGGLAAWDELTGANDSAQRVRARIAEDAEALALAGRKPINLGLLDAQYRKPPPALGLADLEGAVSGEVASAARVYVPAGLGGHPDHLLVRRYGRMLRRAGMPVTLYADLPYCILHGWPGWVDGREPDPHRDVDSFWRSFLAEVPEMPPLRSAEVVRLCCEEAAAKLAAMRRYETQFAALDYGARHLLEDPEIHRFEVRWELIGDRGS